MNLIDAAIVSAAEKATGFWAESEDDKWYAACLHGMASCVVMQCPFLINLDSRTFRFVCARCNWGTDCDSKTADALRCDFGRLRHEGFVNEHY